jgi:hypothetical protein
MLRGELSNMLSPMFGVDFRILLEEPEISKVGRVADRLLMASGMPGFLMHRYKWRDGAIDWISREFDYRAVGFIVKKGIYSGVIAEVLLQGLSEVKIFEDRYKFKQWVRVEPDLVRVFTNDPYLLGLNEVVDRHSGWTERVHGL